ncbi:MAG: DNA repair protein RecO [Candidatus Peribacteraceae bacterium]|nr:DNA repair protein RecO [Candidatus Peribacteraceae bacterium]
MNRTITDEAIILKTYDIGEADRFCILLTKDHGRLAARANGVRRMTSRRSGSLLALERSDIEIRQRGTEYLITSATCIESSSDCSADLQAFNAVQQGIDILLRLIHEGQSLPTVYTLTADFLRACAAGTAKSALPLYILQLLFQLGTLPSLTHSSVSHRPFGPDDRVVYSTHSGGLVLASEDKSGRLIGPDLLPILQSSLTVSLSTVTDLPDAMADRLQAFVQFLLVAEMGAGLKSPPVAVGRESGSTPTSYVS